MAHHYCHHCGQWSHGEEDSVFGSDAASNVSYSGCDCREKTVAFATPDGFEDGSRYDDCGSSDSDGPASHGCACGCGWCDDTDDDGSEGQECGCGWCDVAELGGECHVDNNDGHNEDDDDVARSFEHGVDEVPTYLGVNGYHDSEHGGKAFVSMGDDVECGAEIALHRAKCNLDCSIELHHGDKEPAQEAEAADTRPFPFVRLPAETKMQIVSLVARRQPLELARVSKAMYSDCAAVFLQWAGLPRDYRLPFKLTPLSAYLLATRFGCQRCGKVGVNRIVWELRVRACDDCLYRGTADSRRLKAIMPRELLILLPSVKVTQHPECDLRKTRTLLRKDDAREWSRKLAAGNCEWMGLSSVLAELLAERNTLKRVEEAFSKVVKCKSRWYPNRWELQPRLAEAERAYRTLWPAKLEAHLEEAIERGSDFQGLKSDIKSGWYPTTMWVRHVVESARDDVEREVAIASARTVVEQGLRAKGCGEPVPPLEEFSAWQMFRESIASGRLSEAKIAENAVPVVEIVHRTAALRAAVADGEGRKTQAYTTALHSILRRNGRGQLIECSDLQSLVEATKKAVAVEISSTKRGRKRKRAVVEAILLLLRERPVMDIPETAYTLRKRSHALQALVNSKSDDVFERNVPFWLQSTKAFRAMCNEVTTKSDASEDAFAPAMQPDQPQLVASAIISEWISKHEKPSALHAPTSGPSTTVQSYGIPKPKAPKPKTVGPQIRCRCGSTASPKCDHTCCKNCCRGPCTHHRAKLVRVRRSTAAG